MTTKRWLPRTALGALTALLGLGPSCAAPAAPGELMMVLQTDLALPKDVDSVRLQILVRGDPRRDQIFDKLGDDARAAYEAIAAARAAVGPRMPPRSPCSRPSRRRASACTRLKMRASLTAAAPGLQACRACCAQWLR